MPGGAFQIRQAIHQRPACKPERRRRSVDGGGAGLGRVWVDHQDSGHGRASFSKGIIANQCGTSSRVAASGLRFYCIQISGMLHHPDPAARGSPNAAIEDREASEKGG